MPKPVFWSGTQSARIDGHAPECFHAVTLPSPSTAALSTCALAVW